MSFRFVKQKDSMQCGVVALAMVCRHFGMQYSTSFLDKFCHATTQGVSMLGISQAAKELGLDNATGKLTVDQLREAPLPAILHWNQNHFVVLYKISKSGRKYYIADPGKGKRAFSKEEFEQHWASIKGDTPKGVGMYCR